MKGYWKIILSVLILLACFALAIPAYQWFRKNPVSLANRLKTQAKREYLAGEYAKAFDAYQMLVDSLKNTEDPVNLNYAHSAFLSSDVLLKEFQKRNKGESNMIADSALLQVAAFSREQYGRLSAIENKKISSIASNQLGYSLVRGNNVIGETESDSLLFEALDHFKNALRDDPKNDSARFNYELIKKIIDFPETILSETKALIAQKRYKKAAALLEMGMRRDPRLRKQKDFMERLRTVIAIDSLKSRGI